MMRSSAVFFVFAALASILASPLPTSNASANDTLMKHLKDDSAAASALTASGSPNTSRGNSPGASQQNLQTFVNYAMAAYAPNVHDNLTWFCNGGCCTGSTAGTKVVASFGVDGNYEAYGYVAINPSIQTVITAFRGTSSIEDWINDASLILETLSMPLTNYGQQRSGIQIGSVMITPQLTMPTGVEVHSGFFNYYETARKTVQTTLYGLLQKNPSYTFVFVGHSMGGSLASLAAIDFVDLFGSNLVSNVHIYTYGQPRTGNLAWVNWLGSLGISNVARVTRQEDLVPHLPPLGSGYVHFSQEFGIDINGNMETCISSGVGGESINCENENFWWPSEQAHLSGYFNVAPCDD